MLDFLVCAQTSQVEGESERSLERHRYAAQAFLLLLLDVLSCQQSPTNRAAHCMVVDAVAQVIPVWLTLAALATKPAYGEGMWDQASATSRAALQALTVGGCPASLNIRRRSNLATT